MADPKRRSTDKELIEAQARLEKIRRAAKALADQERTAGAIEVTAAHEVPDEKLESVFGGRLIRGAFQLLVGPGEAGKGMCSTDLIARMSTGAPFPGEGTQWRSPIVVAVCVTEDSAGRVKARLMAAGADLRKVFFVAGPPSNRGGLVVPRPIAMDDDAGAMLRAIQQKDAKAVFLETTLEHLGDSEGRKQVSTNNEAEVRRAMSPIVALCREGGLIGWGVMHPRKSSDGGIQDSISGSAAFNNVGRTVMHVYRDPLDKEASPWRLLVTSKANYMAARPATYRFRIEPWDKDPNEGRVVWGIEGKTLIDSRKAEDVWQQLRELNMKRRDYSVRDAEEMLRKFLAGGMKTVDEIKKQAEDDDVAWRSVELAKVNLGVESVKGGFPAKVLGWRLPPDEL